MPICRHCRRGLREKTAYLGSQIGTRVSTFARLPATLSTSPCPRRSTNGGLSTLSLARVRILQGIGALISYRNPVTPDIFQSLFPNARARVSDIVARRKKGVARATPQILHSLPEFTCTGRGLLPTRSAERRAGRANQPNYQQEVQPNGRSTPPAAGRH